MQHIEIEYKLLISQDIFKKILKDYKHQIHNHYTQINHYFTHPLLQEKKYMLRIREKNNTFELTLKRPMGMQRLETNIDITAEQKELFIHHQIINNDITDILKKENIPLNELHHQFSLTTHRYDILFLEGVLSLDENYYLDQHDYELEFEVNDEQEGYQKFLEIIKPYSLIYRENCPSKIKRILDSL